MKVALTLYPTVQEAMRHQHFMPNRLSMMCSRRNCSYWRHCEREWGGMPETRSDSATTRYLAWIRTQPAIVRRLSLKPTIRVEAGWFVTYFDERRYVLCKTDAGIRPTVHQALQLRRENQLAQDCLHCG